MDIFEMQKKKKETERAIWDIITLFSKETGMMVDDIKIRKIDITTVSDDRAKAVYAIPEIYIRL